MPCIVRTVAGELNRYQIKRFKSSDAMYKFLAAQSDNKWRETPVDLKSGVYFQQMDRDGIRWISVRELIK